MTAELLNSQEKQAPSRKNPQEFISYGFDESIQSFFYEKEGNKEFCDASKLLQVTENYELDEDDRGALLLGIPF